MSDVTAASGATSPGIATSSTVVNSNADEFDDFLQLLTAQVENQDPLEPLDSTQFVEQLATFSSLEEQVKTNDWLEELSTMVSDMYTVYIGDYMAAAQATGQTDMTAGDAGFMSLDSGALSAGETSTVTFEGGQISGGDLFSVVLDGADYTYKAGTQDTIVDVIAALASAIESGEGHATAARIGSDITRDDSQLAITAGADVASITVKAQSATS